MQEDYAKELLRSGIIEAKAGSTDRTYKLRFPAGAGYGKVG